MNCKPGLFLAHLWIAALLVTAGPIPAAPVKVTEDQIAIPTYLMGEPEPNPIFYDGRGSQGAQGRVYPYPLYDTLTNIKSNKLYRIVYLENEYVRLGILPEIGGRLFEAVDKSNGYDFVYHQHVIKPALIGLIGAWISGGIEWNIPHHHRATTALPVQYKIEETADGSKTVWVGELELRHRMRWAVGYTLHPRRSYLECTVRILNRTPLANSMLCFANVAVHVNNDYQVIYPPHTQFVTFHSKHEFTTWPIATTRYAGEDFSRGVDVSRYSNHVGATSMFAWNYQDDFFAGYDHGRHAGIISVADHHIVPGKKFWTWGNGPRGRMWDKILTDSDGPYIELMVGAYSDNQPDYSWLQPYETKSFQMFWYPFRDIDGVKKANLDAAVNLEVSPDGTGQLGFCTTTENPKATVLLRAGTNVLVRETCAISPGRPYLKKLSLPVGVQEKGLRASLLVGDNELIAFSPEQLDAKPMPRPAQDPPPPPEIKTVEELYLVGQRLEQFHAPGRAPELYWEEALRRDPGDARVNTAWAIRLLKQARFEEAEAHLRTAIERLTGNYTAPKDGEAFYYLGVALRGRALLQSNSASLRIEAFDALYKATWSQAWRGPGYLALAELASLRDDPGTALKYVENSLEANALNPRALGLKAALLRRAGKPNEAKATAEMAARMTDPLDPRLMAERWLAGDKTARAELMRTVRQFPNATMETAVEYSNAGLWEDGISVLQLFVDEKSERVPGLAYYYLADLYDRRGNPAKAEEFRRLAAAAPTDYGFPFQAEAIPVLRRAIGANPQDSRAPYYLGNLLYDWQPQEAMRLWQQSIALDPSFAIAHRNLAFAYSHAATNSNTSLAIAELELAVQAPKKYALHFAELDELYQRTATAPSKRLDLLEQNESVVCERDDTLSREIGLLVFAGRYDRAIELMTGRKFSVWEGGSLEVSQHWVNAHVLRGRKRLSAGHAQAALLDLEQASRIPENLPSDTQGPERSAEMSYWIGLAYEQLAQPDKAKAAWQKSAEVYATPPDKVPVSDLSVQIYYSALARKRLGQDAQTELMLNKLVQSANEALSQPVEAERPGRRRRRQSSAAQAHYVAGLGHNALGHVEQAKAQFKLALETEPDFLYAEAELAKAH